MLRCSALSPFATNTVGEPSASTIAPRGMRSAALRRSSTMPTRANMPGLSARFGSRTSIVALKVPVAGSSVGLMRWTRPAKLAPARASTTIVDCLLGAQLRELALRHVHLGDQRIEVRDLEGAIVDVDGVADLDVARGDHAGDRRADFRVADIQLRQIARRLEPLHFGASVVDGGRGDELAIEQLQRALVLALELAQVHFGLLQLEAQAIAIEAGEHLSGLHRVAFLDQDLADFARDLRDDSRFLVGLQRRRAGVDGEHLAAGGHLDLHGNRGRGALLGVLGRALAAAVQGDDRNPDQQRTGR